MRGRGHAACCCCCRCRSQRPPLDYPPTPLRPPLTTHPPPCAPPLTTLPPPCAPPLTTPPPPYSPHQPMRAQSILTGESGSVAKDPSAVSAGRVVVQDKTNTLFRWVCGGAWGGASDVWVVWAVCRTRLVLSSTPCSGVCVVVRGGGRGMCGWCGRCAGLDWSCPAHPVQVGEGAPRSMRLCFAFLPPPTPVSHTHTLRPHTPTPPPPPIPAAAPWSPPAVRAGWWWALAPTRRSARSGAIALGRGVLGGWEGHGVVMGTRAASCPSTQRAPPPHTRTRTRRVCPSTHIHIHARPHPIPCRDAMAEAGDEDTPLKRKLDEFGAFLSKVGGGLVVNWKSEWEVGGVRGKQGERGAFQSQVGGWVGACGGCGWVGWARGAGRRTRAHVATPPPPPIHTHACPPPFAALLVIAAICVPGHRRHLRAGVGGQPPSLQGPHAR